MLGTESTVTTQQMNTNNLRRRRLIQFTLQSITFITECINNGEKFRSEHLVNFFLKNGRNHNRTPGMEVCYFSINLNVTGKKQNKTNSLEEVKQNRNQNCPVDGVFIGFDMKNLC